MKWDGVRAIVGVGGGGVVVMSRNGNDVTARTPRSRNSRTDLWRTGRSWTARSWR